MTETFDVEGPPQWFPESFFDLLISVWPDLKFSSTCPKTFGFVRYRFYPEDARQAYLIGKAHAEHLKPKSPHPATAEQGDSQAA